jgi:hypothetical protein
MVQSAVSKTSDSTYGVPATTATVDFTRKTIGTLSTPGYYVESANSTATGICQACHTPTGGFPGEVKYWRNNQTEDVNSDGTDENTAVASRHNSTAVCTDCHQHDNQFAAGCTGYTATDLGRWPDSSPTTRIAPPTPTPARTEASPRSITRTSPCRANNSTENSTGWCRRLPRRATPTPPPAPTGPR